MKKAFLLFVCLILLGIQAFPQKVVETNYYSQNADLGGEAVIKQSTKEVVGSKAIVTFEVEAPTAKAYHADFWMFPAKLKDGSLAEYSVLVNGNAISGKIAPTVGDWHYAILSGNGKIHLNKGTNTISIVGTVPNIPNVEHVKLSSTLSKAKVGDSQYSTFKSAIKRESAAKAKLYALKASSRNTTDTTFSAGNITRLAETTPDAEDPLYDYSFMLDINLNYTFYTTVYFNKGQQVFLATNGVNNFSHVLEFFSYSHPEIRSWSATSNSSCLASLNLTIPESDIYCVRVRSYLNATTGLCNLNINGENYYEEIPVYSMGVRCIQETDQAYNTFTCKSIGDPVVWIEDGPGIPGKIMAFNDNYENNGGTFAWGNDARTNMKYPRTAYSALLSTAHSYNPTGKCDLYMKCKNVDFASWREEDRDDFPLLTVEDAIQSSPATPVYNCFSWAGGITSYWEWPEDESSSYFYPIYWVAYTDYLASRGYTPVSATQDNGVVALWGLGNDDDMDNWVIQHASIRKGADANAHGYDWESKMGSLERIFHPRDALEGFSYGRIVAYFRKDPSLGYAMTLEEEIADGTSKIEYTNFNTDEKAYLAAKIDGISDNVLAQFNTLYAQWKSVTENTPYSSPDRIANCDIYRKTLSHCQSHPELIYAVYAKLEEGGIAAAKLVKDLTLDKNRDVMERIRKSNPSGKTRNGVKVYRPMLSNTVAYVKELLAKESKALQKARNKAGHTTDISYSNAHEFDISLSKDAVSVDFTIDNASSVYLNLLDLYGKVAYSRLNGEKLQNGEYSLKLPIGKEDIYLVQLIINGRANVKKVVVNKH